MTDAVMLDIAIVAVVALFTWLGWKRGLFRSLGELAAVIAALALAYLFAVFVSEAVVEIYLRPAAHGAVEEQVDRLLAETVTAVSPREELERVLEAVPNGFLREKALALVDGMGLSTAEQAGWSARETLVSLGQRAVDTALDTVVRSAIRSLVCAVAFVVLLAALRIAIRTLDLATKLPVIHQLNGLGGLLLGAGKGVVLAYLAVWILAGAGILGQEVLDGSLLVSLAGKLLPIGA